MHPTRRSPARLQRTVVGHPSCPPVVASDYAYDAWNVQKTPPNVHKDLESGQQNSSMGLAFWYQLDQRAVFSSDVVPLRPRRSTYNQSRWRTSQRRKQQVRHAAPISALVRCMAAEEPVWSSMSCHTTWSSVVLPTRTWSSALLDYWIVSLHWVINGQPPIIKIATHPYSVYDKNFALTLHCCSPDCYRLHGKIVGLPNVHSLQCWLQNVQYFSAVYYTCVGYVDSWSI